MFVCGVDFLGMGGGKGHLAVVPCEIIHGYEVRAYVGVCHCRYGEFEAIAEG